MKSCCNDFWLSVLDTGALSLPPPTARSEDELLSQLPAVLLDKIKLPERPVSDGRNKRKRRDAQKYTKTGQYQVDFDLMFPGSLAIILCPETDKDSKLAFRLALGRNKYSPWLYLAVVDSMNTVEETLTWYYVQPKVFSNKTSKHLTLDKAKNKGSWVLDMNSKQADQPFSEDEIVLSWDKEEGETGYFIPQEQYNHACIVLLAMEESREAEDD